MARIKIAVAELEYEEGGNTVWVHSPRGLTVLRITTSGTVKTHRTQGISSHSDVNVQGDIDMFVAAEDQVKEPTPCHDSPTKPPATNTSSPSSAAS